MNKLIYLLWPSEPMERSKRRTTLLEQCAPALLEAGVRHLLMNIDDDRARVPSPTPTTRRNKPFVAEVSIWLEDMTSRDAVESILRGGGFRIAGYLVDEHIYTDYGGNEHARPRDWPDGQRSPGIISVTPLERPKRIPKDKWLRHWFERQGPMSEAMQPRSRYVRNVVRQVLTPDAPPYEGIVEESWPSSEHMTNSMLFFGAHNRLELLKNMAIMLHSVASFLPLWKIVSVTTSEYFVRSSYSD